MPAVTDLTWAQLNEAFKVVLGTNTDTITVDSYGTPTEININGIVGSYPALGSDKAGVLKFLTRLYDACLVAQDTANTGKAVGEKLTAFRAATSTAPVGTFVPVTRTIAARHDLSSSTKIVGTNA